ncbi:MAG: TonB-dependent receptor [Chitinophagaceae bacterium]|nr:TonB-dependent receptor [Chitinophagaceae bacterium]
MNIGRFYGKVVDSTTNKGIEAVSVQLVQSKFDTVTKKRKDTVLAGMLTTKAGNFSLENLPLFGNYKLAISAIGFQTKEMKVAFQMSGGRDMSQALAGVDKDLGNIKLSIDPKMLESVTVTSARPSLSLGIDRKIFNVEKNINSAGGTAIDVMRNVPSVAVDIDGNVTLRNNAPQIFVDGRPSTLTLDQIPADAISSVEIITNPSAKFDASGGTSGILNIVLKKNRKAGYNGSLRAGIDQRAKFNLGGDINVRQGKINVFANANYGQRKSISTGETDRFTFFKYPNTRLTQFDKNTNVGYFAFLRGGIDYFIDNRNTLTVSGVLVNGKFEPNTVSDLYVDTLFNAGTTSSYSQRLSNTTGEFRNRGGMLSFKHNFAKAGKEWTADANYNKSRNENNNLIATSFYDKVGGPLSRQFRQLLDGGGQTEFITVQTDFANPIKDKSKIEMGARMQMRNIDSRNDISFVDPNGVPILVPALSSRYKNEDRVYAGYATFSNAINDFGYQLGLRVESSTYNGTVKTATTTSKDTVISYSNDFPLSFFPSIFLTQKLKNSQELQANFSRRINRPNFFQLFPFTDYSDSLNLSRGNPDLKPEFTYSSEISYQKTFKNNNSLLASVYFKYTDKLITRYQTIETNPVKITDSVLINTYINANSSYVGGLELIGRNTITKWWEVTSNLNLFTSRININDPGIKNQGNIYSWLLKINNSFKLPKNFSIQLSGEYQSKTVLPPGGSGGGGGGFGGGGGGGRGGGGGGFFGQSQTTSQGYIRPNYGIDMAVRYEFLKEKRASVSLSFSDVLRTRRNDIYSESSSFIQNTFRRRDPQFFRLNLNYRFGKFDVSLFKRKNMRGEAEGMQNGMQGVQQ